MERPGRCPGQLYSLMLDCWAAEPEERPGWDELVTRLAALYSLTPDPASQHNPGYTSSGVSHTIVWLPEYLIIAFPRRNKLLL